MRFELKVALRHLGSTRGQTVLLCAGVAVGILVFTFVSALIGGLRVRLTDDVVGDLPHVTLESPTEDAPLLPALDGPDTLGVRQPATSRRPIVRDWRALLAIAAERPGVAIAVPEVVGGGFALRGERAAPISVTGVAPDQLSAIVDVAGGIRAGEARLGPSDVILGQELARDLGVRVGQPVVLRSDRQRQRVLTVTALFDVGNENLNERMVFIELETARALYDLAGGISRIALKVEDLYQAPRLGRALASATGLEAKDWIARFPRLNDALRAQWSSGLLIKAFSLTAVILGVASTLVLAAVRRRAEIGIMLSMGVTRGSLEAIFILQGVLVGLFGSLAGSVLGWSVSSLLRWALIGPDGRSLLPVDPARGSYATAVLLATLASAAAAVLPARVAARVDPVEVIQS